MNISISMAARPSIGRKDIPDLGIALTPAGVGEADQQAPEAFPEKPSKQFQPSYPPLQHLGICSSGRVLGESEEMHGERED